MHSARAYCPCKPGISVTGMDHDLNAFFTIANFPGLGRTEFEALRDFAAFDGEPEECVIDLFEQEGMMDNICISSQMVNRVTRALSKDEEAL